MQRDFAQKLDRKARHLHSTANPNPFSPRAADSHTLCPLEPNMEKAFTPSPLPQIQPGDLPDIAVALAGSGLALMLYGSPGIGKTALLQELGTEKRLVQWASGRHGHALSHLDVVTLSAPELNIEDLLGVPTVEELTRKAYDGKEKGFKVTRWATPAQLDPTRPFVLFIDEPNRCDPSVRNALFQLITGRTTSGGFSLPQGSVVVMAGNRMEDKAGVRSMDTAFSNRCAHMELLVSVESWLEWALQQPDFDPMVRAFIARHPGHLCRFDPAHPAPQQATPRTWAGAGLALPKAPAMQQALLHATVGAECAQLFSIFQKSTRLLPDRETLLHKPEAVPMPGSTQLDHAWALASCLSDHLIHTGSADGPAQSGIRPRKSSPMQDPLGRSVGILLGRMATAGFEEVVVFALQRVWRVIEKQGLLGKGNRAFLSAVQTLGEKKEFKGFLEALGEVV